VSDPGKAEIYVRDPRPLRPPARKRRNETQAMGGSGLTFTCYGEDVTAPNLMTTVCDGSSGAYLPTPQPYSAKRQVVRTP